MNNPEKALDALNDWYDKYGEKTWAMMDKYFEALGVYEAIDGAVDAAKDGIEAALTELYAQIDKYSKEAVEKIWSAVEGDKIVETLKAAVEQAEQLVADLEAMIDSIEKEIANLQAQLEQLKADLENANAQLKAEIEKQIAAIEDAIAKLEAQIAAIEKTIADLQKAIAKAEAAIKEIVNATGATYEEIVAAFEAVMEAFEKVGYDGWVTGEMIPAYAQHSEQIIYNTSNSMDKIIGRK
jgi:chromosome segregation ATPase